MKIFISQPMKGKTKEEIKRIRAAAIKELSCIYFQDDFEVIDNFNEELFETNRPIEGLGISIQLMQDADLVYCLKGWEKAKGCLIEHLTAASYDIKIIYQ